MRFCVLALVACSSAAPRPSTPPPEPPPIVHADPPPPPPAVPPPLVPQRQVVTVVSTDDCGFILDSIYFEPGSAIPPPHQERVLDDTADMFTCQAKKGEPLHVEIGGHTDDRERDPLALSESRAAWIKGELVKRGVDPALLTTAGYGAALPRDRRKTEAARAKNRRVEFLVIRAGQ